MFTAPRFVVVDDKSQHLQAILQAFQSLGSPCMGLQYDSSKEFDRLHFRGVRGLFLDLHLLEGALGSDHKRHYAQIAALLENNIHPDGGPFVLIVWTEHPQLGDELIAYLDASLDRSKPHARPVAIFPLEKGKFIDVDTGVVLDAVLLRNAIEEKININVQLAALLNWETDVLSAAGAALSAIVAQVPADKRNNAELSGALDVVLSRLARAAIGSQNVGINPRMALNTLLAPILADRILNQDIPDAVLQLWSRAITRHEDPELGELGPEDAGRINRMIHIAFPGAENIRPTDWGAVVEFPNSPWTDEKLQNQMGITIAEFLGGELKLEGRDRGRCVPCCVRIGAGCDYAQQRKGPITYLLGVEVPEDAARKMGKDKKPLRVPGAVWTSPLLVREGMAGPYRLYVHSRFSTSLARSRCTDWKPKYRIREQLLMQLISHASENMSRPGIVEL